MPTKKRRKVSHLVPLRGPNPASLCGIRNVEWYVDRVSPTCQHCLRQLKQLNEAAAR